MAIRLLDQLAPDFSADDVAGRPFSLSALRGQKHVVLVLNRGCT
jgi:peroxiredoxin